MEAVRHVLAEAPWVVAIAVPLTTTTMVRGIRGLIHSRHEPDAQRRFSGGQRAVIFSRAGHRCEQSSLIEGRCRENAELHAEHVHSHSRGGATIVENGQALCRRHNKQKAARVPWNWELARLARRRQAYFPAGMETLVARRPRTTSR